MKHSFLDWSAYRDAGMGDAYADIPKYGDNYGKAIAACINSRQCEQQGKQVMCPSYRISEDPMLSTGGRVRLLKAALSQPQDNHPLLTPELENAMELCVSCKGCKRECEANVDMPLIKAEYLAQRNAVKGISLRSRLFADFPNLLTRFPILAFGIRLYNRIPALRKPVASLLNLNPAVPLPEPQKTKESSKQNIDLSQIAVCNPETDATASVYLWLDTFSRHFEPDILASAQRVLEKGGYSLIPHTETVQSRPICCGRTYLAQGMIDRARDEMLNLIEHLYPIAEAGHTILGLEASCVLGLRDDAGALGLNKEQQAKRQLVAKNTLLLEEFLAREIKSNRLNLPFKDVQESATTTWQVHGHCHQKATGAMKSMRRVLKFLPMEFELIESSCCGMAGTFGLEGEHAEHSRRMAEQDLLPAIANHPERPLIANGFSCRHQIRSLTQIRSDTPDKQPIHLAQVIDQLLA